MAEYGEEQNKRDEKTIETSPNGKNDALESNWEPTNETLEIGEIKDIWEPTKEEESNSILIDNYEPNKENDEIKYTSKNKIIELEENNQLAEMIGIILGDGNLYDDGRKYLLRVTSNRIEEEEFRKYTKNIMTQIFKINPKSYSKKNQNATDLVIQNKIIVKSLIEKGLIPGNKVKNQVSVPDWIKRKKEYTIACLRGIFDTDGSVYLRNTQKSFGLNFKNGSLPLVIDFKEMCESLGIETQKIPKPKTYHDPKTGKISKAYQVTIENKFQIAKFLYIIKPKKWDFRMKIIGTALLSLSDPNKRFIIKKTLDLSYPDKKVHYSKAYADLLKTLCEKQGFLVNNETIFIAINNALADKRRTTNSLNIYGLKLIEELRQKLNIIIG